MTQTETFSNGPTVKLRLGGFDGAFDVHWVEFVHHVELEQCVGIDHRCMRPGYQCTRMVRSTRETML